MEATMKSLFFAIPIMLSMSTPSSAATYIKGSLSGVDSETGLDFEFKSAFLLIEFIDGGEFREHDAFGFVLVNGFARVGNVFFAPEITGSGRYLFDADFASFGVRSMCNSLGFSTTFASRTGNFIPYSLTTVVSGVRTDFERSEISGRLSLSAVPEPSTWLLFLLGFGALGYAVRKKRTLSVTYT